MEVFKYDINDIKIGCVTTSIYIIKNIFTKCLFYYRT